MEIPIIVALISLAGSLFSVIMVFLTNIKVKRIEIDKAEIENRFAQESKLLDKRFEIYPSVYQRVSDFTKLYYDKNLEVIHVRQLNEFINKWDSEFSIFMGPKLQRNFAGLRILLNRLVKKDDPTIVQKLSEKEYLKKLRKCIEKVEISLKSDIGTFGKDFKDDQIKDFNSWQAVSNAIKKDFD